MDYKKVKTDTTAVTRNKNDFYEQNNLMQSNKTEIQEALNKFNKILEEIPKKDASPIYTQIGGSFYDHPAEQLNKVALGGKKAPNKCPVPEGR